MYIEVKDLRVDIPRAGELFTIKHLAVPSASKVLIYGASGRGKTTLLHLLAGLHLPTKGSVSLGDTRLDILSEDARARFRKENIGFVFQKLNLIDHLSCEENIRLALPQSVQARAQALNALDDVGLGARASELCVKLSLGEQQRVAVARVLAARPRVILADEPTSSLDAHNASLVVDALFAAAGTRSTLIVVSHDERLRSRFERRLAFEELVAA